MTTKKISKLHSRIPYFLGIIVPIFFFLLVTSLGNLWNYSGYSQLTVGMSELGAVDSPYRHVMNFLGFSFLGATITLFCISLLNDLTKKLQLSIALIIASIGGFSLFAVGFFPCDSACIDITQTGKMHSLLSTLSAIAISAGAILAAHPLYEVLHKKVGYSSFYLGMLSLMAGPLMFLPGFDAYSGLIQRVGLGFSLLWMMSISYYLIVHEQK